jgi:uncharacterized protein (DUF885 family)
MGKGRSAAKKAAKVSVGDFAAEIERFTRDREDLLRFYDLEHSESRKERVTRFLQEWQAWLESVDTDSLDEDGSIDHVLFETFLAKELDHLEFRWGRLQEARSLIPFAAEVVALEETRREVVALDGAEAAESLGRIVSAVRDVRTQLERGRDGKKKRALRPGASLAYRAAKETELLKGVLEFWFKHYDGFKPQVAWWIADPYARAIKALDEHLALLKEVAGVEGDDPPLVGDPVGREALMRDIRSEIIDESPEDLIAIAEREFAWCENEYVRAAKEMGCGSDWKAALEQVKARHVPPGDQDEFIAEEARRAIRFVEENDLVTVDELCKETWRVEMMDEKRQKLLPFAGYGGQKILVSYPLSTMDHDSKMMSLRGNNMHFTRNVTQHELIPGHHLQLYMAARHKAHRQVFKSVFLVEGWALHWEMLLWDLGYPQGPEDRIGMLFWRMHRCARIIVSLRFHLGEMSPDEMIDFLVERCGHERFSATSEVRRYLGDKYVPLYQCAYMIGGLQLRALYKELVDGGAMSAREFHDRVLRENSIPVGLIGRRLTGA